MNFRMDAAVDDIVENVFADEVDARHVILVGLANEPRQPVRMPVHPSLLSAGE